MRPLFAIAWLLLPALVSGVSSAAPPTAEPGVAVHFEQSQLPDLVRAIGMATGESFIHGEELRGRASITVPERVSPAEARELLNAVLYMKGFVAIPISTGAHKIVPIIHAKSSSPFVVGELDPERERSIATLLRLEFASATSVVDTLKSFVASSGLALAYPPTNSVILAGTEAQLRRLLVIARALDQSADENLIARALRYRSVSKIAPMLEEAFNVDRNEAAQVEIWTDERSNMLLLRARPRRLEEVRAFLDDIDRPVESEGAVRVIRVRNRDTEQIVEILRSMAQGSPSPPRSEMGRMLREVLISHDLMGRSFSLTVDAATRSLLVAADQNTFELLADVVSRLDRAPSRISVELLVFEITAPSSFTFGVDFLMPLLEPKSREDFVLFLRSSPTGASRAEPDPDVKLFSRFARDPLLLTFQTPDGQTLTFPVERESATFEADEKEIQTNLLLRPHLVVVSGEENELFVGNNIPVISGGSNSQSSSTGDQADTETAQSQSSTAGRVERRDVGLGLRVKPTLGQTGDVRLELDISISGLVPSIAGSVARVGPTIQARDISADIRLRDGEYAIMGMATDRRETVARRGVPFLMDIPLLGFLFGRIEKTWVDTDLVVVARARVLRSVTDEKAETIRRQLAFERSLSRTNDLRSLGVAPYAVLLETLSDEDKAHHIADTFAEDGFTTRVSSWKSRGDEVYDVYLTGFASFSEAGDLARRLSDAGWGAEITVLTSENELAGE